MVGLVPKTQDRKEQGGGSFSPANSSSLMVQSRGKPGLQKPASLRTLCKSVQWDFPEKGQRWMSLKGLVGELSFPLPPFWPLFLHPYLCSSCCWSNSEELDNVNVRCWTRVSCVWNRVVYSMLSIESAQGKADPVKAQPRTNLLDSLSLA